MIPTAICSLLFGIAAVTDVRCRRIPNWLTLPACVSGMGYHALNGNFYTALQGLLTGFFLLVLPYAFRAVGGGDVKLLAAAGSWTGVPGVVSLFFYGSLAGGVMALLIVLWVSGVGQLLNILQFPATLVRTLPDAVKKRGLPYAVPMGAGFAGYLALGPII